MSLNRGFMPASICTIAPNHAMASARPGDHRRTATAAVIASVTATPAIGCWPPSSAGP